MAHFLIIHGTEGSPEGNWFPWLKQKLSANGHTVSVPQFPTPGNQFLSSWIDTARTVLQTEEPGNTILIGHSTGAVAVLHLAELADKPYRAIYSICPFTCNLGIEKYDRLNETFINHSLDWEKVKQGALEWQVFAGDNDPYVPLSRSQQVAQHLQCPIKIIPDGGHLNAESGYKQFPELLESILRLDLN